MPRNLFAFFFMAALVIAAPFASSRAAESWGLPDEQPATFEARVVDVLCVLNGNCPKDCGGGRRLLGLLQKNGDLILAMKNADPFAGAVRDLLPYCGKTITADGLFMTNEGVTAFALQRIKPQGGDWISANGFVRDWAKAHGVAPNSPEAEEWYRHDRTVAARIAKEGKLGLGPKADPKPETGK